MPKGSAGLAPRASPLPWFPQEKDKKAVSPSLLALFLLPPPVTTGEVACGARPGATVHFRRTSFTKRFLANASNLGALL